MNHAAWLLWALLLTVASGPLEAQDWIPDGKRVTDRSVRAAVVVDAPPDEVFRLWTTREGARRFLATDAVIDPVPGGPYEMYFLPRDDEDADQNSTRGATVLRVVPDRFLAFEWTARPTAPELDLQGLRLWVEIRFVPVGSNGTRTSVELTAHGFGQGADWDRVFDFDARSWAEILYALDRVIVDPGYRPAWIGDSGPGVLDTS